MTALKKGIKSKPLSVSEKLNINKQSGIRNVPESKIAV
jgi:hypothetical protein